MVTISVVVFIVRRRDGGLALQEVIVGDVRLGLTLSNPRLKTL